MKFKITKQSKETLARAATLELAHAKIETPFFMPVGTNGSVKGISMEEIQALGYNLILGNTYHLYLKPGDELIDKMGKLRKYINWPGAILTDSGGYQVFSLGQNYESYGKTAESSLSQVVKRGVWFRSHIDGSKHLFTPEKVIDIQRNLGSDIMMVLDECTEFPATHERAEKSMKGTHRWAKEASDYWGKLKAESEKLKEKQALFGIVQGSTFEDLREESAKYISSLDFDGIAVGGVSVGEGKDHMYQVMRWVGPLLPKDKPHYLMGIGEPEDIIEAVKWGFDMFDCVLPTRLGRHGTVWTTADWQKFPKIDLRKSKFELDQTPIMENCGCPACSAGYTKAYLSHLIRSKEMLGMRLASLHNLWILAELMRKIRANKLNHF
ncbi:MAG: tRNA guanosine(34) transglycosylase Tgt [Candidatus Berkelbacteria bacterium]